jgi:hypothetical protein
MPGARPAKRAALDDANVTTRRISDQLGHAQVSMMQDRCLGRRLTDRQTADVLEGIIPGPDSPVSSKGVPKVSRRTGSRSAERR